MIWPIDDHGHVGTVCLTPGCGRGCDAREAYCDACAEVAEHEQGDAEAADALCPACGKAWQGPRGADDRVCGECFVDMNDCGACETCDRAFGPDRLRRERSEAEAADALRYEEAQELQADDPSPRGVDGLPEPERVYPGRRGEAGKPKCERTSASSASTRRDSPERRALRDTTADAPRYETVREELVGSTWERKERET